MDGPFILERQDSMLSILSLLIATANAQITVQPTIIPFCQDDSVPSAEKAAFFAATNGGYGPLINAGSQGVGIGAYDVYLRSLVWNSITQRRHIQYGTTTIGKGCFGVIEIRSPNRSVTCIEPIQFNRSQCRL